MTIIINNFTPVNLISTTIPYFVLFLFEALVFFQATYLVFAYLHTLFMT